MNRGKAAEDLAAVRSVKPIAGASTDCGLVVRQSDFLEALEAPEVRQTLDCAREILRSEEFPPEDPLGRRS